MPLKKNANFSLKLNSYLQLFVTIIHEPFDQIGLGFTLITLRSLENRENANEVNRHLYIWCRIS